MQNVQLTLVFIEIICNTGLWQELLNILLGVQSKRRIIRRNSDRLLQMLMIFNGRCDTYSLEIIRVFHSVYTAFNMLGHHWYRLWIVAYSAPN